MIFIDASHEFAQGTDQNKLRDQDVQKIVATYKRAAGCGEIRCGGGASARIVENEFNLNIPRYVETLEDEEEIDIILNGNEYGRKVAKGQRSCKLVNPKTENTMGRPTYEIELCEKANANS